MKLDLKPFIDAWGSAVTFKVGAPDGSLHFCGVDVAPSAAGTIQTNDVYTTTGDPLYAADFVEMQQGEAQIAPADYLGNGNEPGVLAFEAVKTYGKPKLSVLLGETSVLEFELPLSLSSVKDMYRWLNIRSACGDSSGEPSSLGPPGNFPDDECDGRHFVFVHGYNVNPAQARVWADAMFKRLWWSGSKSRFTAVDWRGDESQFSTLMHGDVSPDYYANVRNAFMSAPAFVQGCGALAGTKTLLAHSLGNMLVSSAVKDCGLTGYAKYYMLNAAVPMEAYDVASGVTAESKAGMTHPEWVGYPDRVRASHWWELFPVGDGRRLLTWKGRFANVTDTVNYYSSEEEVLANGNGVVPNFPRRNHAWSDQELWKGNKPITDVPLVSMGRDEGGWAFKRDHYVYEQPPGPPAPATLRRRRPDETTNLTDAVLRGCPFFGHFANRDIYTSTNGVMVATNAAYRAQLLADAIPSESFAAGANAVPAWGDEGWGKNNVNMAVRFKDANNFSKSAVQNWIHSLFVGAPYMCVHGFYDDMVSRIPKEVSNE